MPPPRLAAAGIAIEYAPVGVGRIGDMSAPPYDPPLRPPDVDATPPKCGGGAPENTGDTTPE